MRKITASPHYIVCEYGGKVTRVYALRLKKNFENERIN